MIYGKEYYGTSLYGLEAENEIDPEKRAIDLMKYLPDIYQEVHEMKELQTVAGIEAGNLKYNIEDLLNQFFIQSATWGLDFWEKELGLQTDRSKSFDRRREITMSKVRGTGTTTKEMIKKVAFAFSGGDVEVSEYPEESRFVIQFIGIKGIPPNMSDLIAAIERIKPAHLAYSFKYTYTAWSQLNGLTWGEANTKAWGELRIYEGA